jgi:hypothetical protein
MRTATETETGSTSVSSRRTLGLLSTLIVAVMPLSGCADRGEAAGRANHAATVETVAGSLISKVTITKEAAKRIDLKTEKVKRGAKGIEIPYGAVLYDPNGKTWTFVNLDGLTFQRTPIAVDHIVGDVASLASGPSVGAAVVTLGAAQLYGAEIGVGDE